MSENIPRRPDETPEPETPADFEYSLLVGHERTNGTYKTDEQLRMEYIELTDKLVYSMTHGVEVTDRETGETRLEKPDVVVWLDKSARPLAWLTKELWGTLARDIETGEVPEAPDFKFVNIDREQWVNTVDPNGVGRIDMKQVDKGIIRSLRSIFISPTAKRDGLTEAIDSAPAELDGKTVLVVDEVRSTGRTARIAKDFFEEAFPTARVATAHWMAGMATRGQAIGNSDLPVWYKKDDIYGRGVGNRMANVSQRSSNTTQRLGAWFLSTRLPGGDPKAKQLRKEFEHLAADPDVPVVPTHTRPDFKERLAAFNHKPFEDVAQDIRRIKGIEK